VVRIAGQQLQGTVGNLHTAIKHLVGLVGLEVAGSESFLRLKNTYNHQTQAGTVLGTLLQAKVGQSLR
jgi:hypothetical protein